MAADQQGQGRVPTGARPELGWGEREGEQGANPGATNMTQRKTAGGNAVQQDDKNSGTATAAEYKQCFTLMSRPRAATSVATITV